MAFMIREAPWMGRIGHATDTLTRNRERLKLGMP